MFASFLFLLSAILSWNIIETVRLEYKHPVGRSLKYSEIQITDVHDAGRHLDEITEYTEMIYTERVIEIDSNKSIQVRLNSFRMFPLSRYKYDLFLKIMNQTLGKRLISRDVDLSLVDGNIILPPPNEAYFPEEDVEIGKVWADLILDSIGEMQYKLVDIDENQIARIEFESNLGIFSDAILTGKLTFDIQRGITLKQTTDSSSSVFPERRTTRRTIKKLLSINYF